LPQVSATNPTFHDHHRPDDHLRTTMFIIVLIHWELVKWICRLFLDHLAIGREDCGSEVWKTHLHLPQVSATNPTFHDHHTPKTRWPSQDHCSSLFWSIGSWWNGFAGYSWVIWPLAGRIHNNFRGHITLSGHLRLILFYGAKFFIGILINMRNVGISICSVALAKLFNWNEPIHQHNPSIRHNTINIRGMCCPSFTRPLNIISNTIPGWTTHLTVLLWVITFAMPGRHWLIYWSTYLKHQTSCSLSMVIPTTHTSSHCAIVWVC
jgi:hypothetical protein